MYIYIYTNTYIQKHALSRGHTHVYLLVSLRSIAKRCGNGVHTVYCTHEQHIKPHNVRGFGMMLAPLLLFENSRRVEGEHDQHAKFLYNLWG